MRFLTAIFLFVLVATAARPDTVLMKNGDHLTGAIEHSDGKQLTIKTDYAGEINLQWPAVKELISGEPVYVVGLDKETVSGKVTTEGSDLVVTTSNAGAVRIPLSGVTTVRSQAEQATYDHSLHPGFIDNWKGAATVGFALARGNSDPTNLSIGFNAARTTLNDKLITYATSIYTSNTTPGTTAVTTNDIRGGARYDHNLTPRVFEFGSGDFEYNAAEDLNLRSIYSGGLGYHAIKSAATTFDILLGANYTRESYSTPLVRNLAGATVGENFTHRVSKDTTLTEQFLFYPDLSNTGQYRFAFDAGFNTKISKWLGWQTTASDRYASDPILGTRTNDIILTTGLNFAFSD
jgi:putative salt-induced outer membrane protein YdiY